MMLDWHNIKIEKESDVAEGFVDDNTILVAWRTEPEEAEVDAVLNATGTLVWSLLDEANTMSAIIDKICTRYEVSTAQAESDVCELLRSLAAKDLVRLTLSDGTVIKVDDTGSET